MNYFFFNISLTHAYMNPTIKPNIYNRLYFYLLTLTTPSLIEHSMMTSYITKASTTAS